LVKLLNEATLKLFWNYLANILKNMGNECGYSTVFGTWVTDVVIFCMSHIQ